MTLDPITLPFAPRTRNTSQAQESKKIHEDSSAPERWVSIRGFDGVYEVSSHGRVRKLDARRRVAGRGKRGVRIMKQRTSTSGYPRLNLSKGGVKTTHEVHRLVLLHFVGDAPDGHVCAHFDGNPANNRLSNLRWATVAENSADAIRHGTFSHGERASGKLTEPQVVEMRRRRAAGEMYKDIAKDYGILSTSVGNICRGQSWKHAPMSAT